MVDNIILLLPNRLVRESKGKEQVKEQLRMCNPLDVDILDRRHLSRMCSYEPITGQVPLHKGNAHCEVENSRWFGMAKQTT